MAIKEGIPDLLELLKVTDDDVRRAAVSVIVEFSKQRKIYLLIPVPALISILDFPADLVVAIKEGIPLVLDLLKDRNYYVRRAAVSAITDLLKQRKVYLLIPCARLDFDSLADLVITIKDGIPDVLNLLTHLNFDIRWAAGSVIAEISKQCKISFLVLVPALISTLQPTSS
jgi:HEAT repeat protein